MVNKKALPTGLAVALITGGVAAAKTPKRLKRRKSRKHGAISLNKVDTL